MNINLFMHKILWYLTELFPGRTRIIKRDGVPYLRRFYITPRRLDKDGKPRSGNNTSSSLENKKGYLGFGIYLHYFYRGDDDLELHNHPWKTATSFILTGGYLEERRGWQDRVETKLVRPLTINRIKAGDFHRITLVNKDKHVWTLFFTFSRSQNWGFWCPITQKYTPQENFVSQVDQGYVEPKS